MHKAYPADGIQLSSDDRQGEAAAVIKLKTVTKF
jgi:hypothetical protein